MMHYFYAACYLSKQAEKDDTYTHKEVIKYIYLAYLAGFIDADKLEEKTESGKCLKSLEGDIKACPDESQCEELTFLQLKSKIIERAKRYK